MLATHFAPSPAGKDIHPGNLRAGILNWGHAKENKGKFILRIEDTVNDRAVESCKQTIIDTLSAFGIIPGCIMFQSTSKQKHLDAAARLVKKDMLCDEDCLRKFPEAAFCRDVIREHIRCCGDVEKFFCLWKRPEHVPCEGLVKYMDCERPVEAWIAGEGLGRKEAYIMARKSLCGTAYSIDLNEVISSTGKEEAMPRLS